MWKGEGEEGGGRFKKRTVFSFRPVLKPIPTTCKEMAKSLCNFL